MIFTGVGPSPGQGPGAGDEGSAPKTRQVSGSAGAFKVKSANIRAYRISIGNQCAIFTENANQYNKPITYDPKKYLQRGYVPRYNLHILSAKEVGYGYIRR